MKNIRPQVFLSYSRQDVAFIQKLRKDLIKASIDCWLDTTVITPGDRLQDAIFSEGIPKCNLFVAYITKHYLDSEWCAKELNEALSSRRITVMPLADSDHTLATIPKHVRDLIHVGVIRTDGYHDCLLELTSRAWASLQETRRLVPADSHILSGTGIFDNTEYRRESLLKRVRVELILAAPNLRSWLSNRTSRLELVNLVRGSQVTVTLILATYETLRPISAEGAQHLRQSAVDIKEMMENLSVVDRQRLRAYFHIGASTLSAVFIDPETPEGILFFSPRWAIQFLPDDRLTCVIDKTINSTTLFKSIYNSVLLMTQSDALSTEDMLKKGY